MNRWKIKPRRDGNMIMEGEEIGRRRMQERK